MKKNSFLKEAIETILIAVGISFVLLKFIFMPCMVNGTSMYPTLKDKQIGYSFIFTKNISVNRFDICVIDPLVAENEKLIVKRVIGLPNETIEYIDNKLYIDGKYVEEDFLSNDTETYDFKVELKEDEYFCLGDNRIYSRDSRYYGSFSLAEIKATNFFVLYPFNEFGAKK